MKLLWAFYCNNGITIVRAVNYPAAFKRFCRTVPRGWTVTFLPYIELSWKQAYDRTHKWDWQRR